LSADFADVEVEMDAANGRVHAYLSAHAEIYRQEYHDNRVLLRCYLPKHLVHHIQESNVLIRVLNNGADPIPGLSEPEA
jgi:GTP-binding protein HflX